MLLAVKEKFQSSCKTIRKQKCHEQCKTFRVMTPDEYSGSRSNEAWFTGVLSLLLLVIMRVRLLGHSALIIRIKNQQRERRREEKLVLQRKGIFFPFFFYCSACGHSVCFCLDIEYPEYISWIPFDFVFY